MKLQHQTEVGASPEDVWDFLQDTRAVVACLPGAELLGETGDDRYEGVLHVAVGPLKMNYAGDVAVTERRGDERRIVLDARGRDKRGSGTVQAHVQLQVQPNEAGSRIDVVSDLALTGRIASLGRGVRDVSNTMFVQFAGALGERVAPGSQPSSAPDADAAPPVPGAGKSGPAPSRRPATVDPTTPTSEIKVLPLVWTISRERLANLLDRLSRRVRPH